MKLQIRTALMLSVVALVAALTGVGSTLATQHLITGKSIKNNSISSVDLRNNTIQAADLAADSVGSEEIQANAIGSEEIAANAVGSADIGPDAVGSEEITTGAVHSSDIGAGQVTPDDVDLPEPEQIIKPPETPDSVSSVFSMVDDVGVYIKEDASSKLDITWTGSAAAGFSPCQFQIRVDGVAAANGAGVIYVANGSTISVSDNVLFEDLPVGVHAIQIWARSFNDGPYTCTVGPEITGINQTFVVNEEVG